MKVAPSSTWKPSALVLILAGSLHFASAWAEHEADHRYNIQGYVLDGNETGIAGLPVQALMGNRPLADGKTDSAGYYSLHLHLHNADLGREVTLRAGGNEARLKVKFDPEDHTTARVHLANFVGGNLVEERLGRFRIPPWIYAIAGVLAVGFVMYQLEARRKKKIRMAKAEASAQHAPAKRKAKRSRRKGH